MLRALALLTVLLCSSLAQDPTLYAKFGNFLQLNPDPVYDLYWVVDGSTIKFAVRVETEGWVGFGFSQRGGKFDSDLIMGFVNDTTGIVTFDDRFYGGPVPIRLPPFFDAEQNWKLLSGTQYGGFTTLEFSRLIDTGDAVGDRVIGETVNLIWAFRTDDDITSPHNFIDRGSQLDVNLLTPQVIDPKTCRCVCPPFNCTSPKVFNPYSYECECPKRNCHHGYTLDHDSCQCKCTRTCWDHEVLDSKYCQCRRRPVTHPPTRRVTYPPRPRTTNPHHRSTHCTHLYSVYSCRNRYNWNGVPCRWIKGKCQPLCCRTRRGYNPAHYRCDSYTEWQCKNRYSCHWYC